MSLDSAWVTWLSLNLHGPFLFVGYLHEWCLCYGAGSRSVGFTLSIAFSFSGKR